MASLDVSPLGGNTWEFLVGETRATEAGIRAVTESVSKFVGFAVLAIAGVYTIGDLKPRTEFITYAPYAVFGIVLTMNYYLRELQALLGRLDGLESYGNHLLRFRVFSSNAITRAAVERRSLAAVGAVLPVNLFAVLIVVHAICEITNATDLGPMEYSNILVYVALLAVNVAGIWEIFAARGKVAAAFNEDFMRAISNQRAA